MTSKREHILSRLTQAALTAMLAGLLACGGQGCDQRDGDYSGGDGGARIGSVATMPGVEVPGEQAAYDLGAVEPESKHLVAFDIRNDSDEPLELTRVRPDCECLTVKRSPKRIGPGASGRVVVEFEAPAVSVPYKSLLIIMTDRPERKVIRLNILSGER